LPDFEYTNETAAIEGNDPDLPPGFTPYIPLTSAYVFSGADDGMRTDLSYWLDRRFMIRRGGSSVMSGGSSVTPTLQQVLLAGKDTGGLLPTGMGFPTDPDEAASKGYVDSTINNINANKCYVDSVGGDDITAVVGSSILPYKTIQAAINAAAAAANPSNRHLVVLSPGIYTEDITMKNYVGMRGDDIESTIIQGKILFPPAYTDSTGSEIALITIRSTSAEAVDVDCGDDLAYVGLRSCYLSSTYLSDEPYKTVAHIHRGIVEVYGTSYLELFNTPTNGSSSVSDAQIFEHVTTPGNDGLSQFTSFNSSSAITCTDTNDNVNLLYTHDNTDTGTINTFLAGLFNVYLNDSSTNHSNNIRVVSHKNAIGRTLSMGNIIRLYMNETNSCNLFIAWSEAGTGDNVAIVRNNHIRVVSGSSSNIWFGAATTTNDNIRIYDTEIIQANSFNYYPKRYTSLGSAGKFYVNTPHQNGDHVLGGALDMSLMNSITPATPDSGHVRMYAYTYAGLENPYFIDSSGNRVRLARDSFFNGYNTETNSLQIGEAVCVVSGLSPLATPKVARALGSDPSKMPCAGIVVQVGGIGSGAVGRIMRAGRTETSFNTTAFTPGDQLYVSATTAGGLTNVSPSGTNISQAVGWCHTSSTGGLMNVYLWTPDTLGGLTPSSYATYANPTFSSDKFMLTNSGGAAKFSTADIPAGQTNTYNLPSSGGTLANYADIQLVPVSVIVGETNGIVKGRVVYQSSSSANKPVVKYASRNDPSTMPVIGVSLASGNYGDNIEVANFGPVYNIDTSMFGLNEMMYLGTNGLLAKPTSLSSDAIIMMGTCLSSNASTGAMLVNIRSYYMDGAFAGSLRYTVKNASTETNATACVFAANDINESVRMVVRGSGNSRGKASIVSSSTIGSFIFSNNRRKPITWDIDMTDTGDEFSHLVWPMMSLVPQIATSNAFLGIGTTNPLTMLHVNGSVTASNGYRTSSNGYSSNEWITYYTTTNLIGTVNSNLQAQITAEMTRATNAEVTISNSFVSADTSLSNALVGVMNSKDTVVSNAFVSADTSLSNALVGVMNSKDTVVSNAFVSADTSLSNSLVGVMNSKDTVVSNAFVSADTSLSNSLVGAIGSQGTSLSNSLVGVMNSKDTVVSNAFVSADASLSNVLVGVMDSKDTSVSNSLVGVMNSKDTVVSNAFISADTSLSNALVGVMNSKDTVVSNAFVSADTSLSNVLAGVMDSKDTSVSNSLVGVMDSKDTSLSNSLVGVMNSKDTVVSNAFVSADTSLSNALVGVMDSKDTSVSNSLVGVMDSKDTSLSNALVGVMNSKDTVVSNAFVSADTSLSNSLVGVMDSKDTSLSNSLVGVMDSKDTSLSNSLVGVMNSKDTVVSNAFVSADSNLQSQITSLGISNAVLAIKFIAVASSNQSFAAGVTTKVAYNNLSIRDGGAYSNAASRWTPGVANSFVKIVGSVHMSSMAINDILIVYVYLNGSQRAVIYDTNTRAGNQLAGFNFVDYSTSATNYYEIYLNSSATRSSTGSSNDNWWAGNVVN
jgi:hypothetical protein